jgi:hypothetical protein
MALRLVRGKISRLPRAGLVSIEASWKMKARGLFRDGRWLGSEVNHSTEASLQAILATRRRTVDHHLGIRSQNPAADLYWILRKLEGEGPKYFARRGESFRFQNAE